MLSIIAALSHHRVIGKDNQLLWHLPNDFSWFKKITMGKPIIMGRKTYDSIGKPLPGRRNLVITRNADLSIQGCEIVTSIQQALDATKDDEEVMVIGGAHLYEQFLPHVDRLYLTLVDANLDGDVYFPDYTSMNWKEIRREEHPADDRHAYPYSFVVFDKA
jgi:dihydrofolate reductase